MVEPDQFPDGAAEEESWPIGFMIIVALVVLYLGWRVLQGVVWVIDKL